MDSEDRTLLTIIFIGIIVMIMCTNLRITKKSDIKELSERLDKLEEVQPIVNTEVISQAQERLNERIQKQQEMVERWKKKGCN